MSGNNNQITMPETKENVKPLNVDSRLGPKECKKRKVNVFLIHFVTVGFTFLTVYLAIELQQFRSKMTQQQVPFTQFIILTGLLIFYNIIMFIFSFSYSSNVKRSKDLKCFNQIQGMKSLFAMSTLIAGASAIFIQREDPGRFSILLKFFSLVFLGGSIGLEYIFVDK